MQLFTSVFSTLVVALSLIGVVSANVHGSERSTRKRHIGRAPNPISLTERNITLNARDFSLEKRFDGSKFSFYDAGLGACGKTNSASDFIVALNIPQWDGGSHCFDTITISYKGKSTQAQIVDQCPGCPFGGLDFSRGLFDFFASESEGIIFGSWNFGGSSAPPATTTKAAPPKTTEKPTSTWTPEPTTTSTKKAATTSSTPPPTTSSSSSSASQSSAASSEAHSASSTQSASPAQTSVTAGPENIAQFNQAMAQLAGVLFAAATAS
ncbi:RlpA-like double-psi beta-barrel-protein domain-containing protein-containing protein [Crucibulum laeve]|uniref:RlpA-like double-psi beta-barrel-protein domain-containing protein-containing protein n=1 Tax=Crucibulum laeve TaxID=68775 RepID=A0A5C3MCB2_9AGAR|nr:RlpA-like double-psi beta-barrel-protein domain-containing protein-containing protein [Crucibulum laeve]